MANTREELVNRFFAISGIGKIQAATGTGMANADLDTRDKCTITREEVITRRDVRDCRNEDLTGSQVVTRLARYTLNYEEPTPQIKARWAALFFGQAAITPGAGSVNEIQRITRVGAATTGAYKLRMTLEGRVVTTKSLAWDATTTDIINALTAARMLYIHPGDVTAAAGTKQKETLVIIGTSTGGNLPVTVIASGSVALAGAGKTINVATLNLDVDTVVANKVRIALAADTDVAAFFAVTGAGANVVLETLTPAANDLLMAVSNTAAVGMTAATSANTTPGVAITLWGATGVTLTFDNRLGNANLPLLEIVDDTVDGGGLAITQVTAGNNYYHTFDRSEDREKVRFSFALGYEDNTATIEKYIDYAVESINPQASLGADPSFQVVILGPWEYDSLEPTLTIPDCVNPEPLLTEECRVKVDGGWESADVNSVNQTLNDNVPVDRLSAFPYDGQDITNIIRGKNPAYQSLLSIFGVRIDHVYDLAQRERTADPVEVLTHYGMPGNRFSLVQDASKMRFQSPRETYVGVAETAAVNIEALPLKDTTDPPIRAEAYLDQNVAFLTT